MPVTNVAYECSNKFEEEKLIFFGQYIVFLRIIVCKI